MGALSAQCKCGHVQIELDHVPDFINDCNCSLCTKADAIWGYFKTVNVRVNGETVSYVRPDRSAPAVELHSCAACETTTHWQLTEAHKKTADVTDSMGVNMHLFASEHMAGIEIRFPDGEAWTGEGAYGYRKPSMILE